MTMVATLAACALMASACGGEPAAEGPTTVTMWARAATGGITKELVSKFNSSQDKVRVDLTVLPLNQEDAKFAAAVRSGSVPDIFGMNDVSVPQFVRTGALRPLNDFVASKDYKAALNPGQMDLATYDGQLYGVPLMLDLSVLWYNKDLFKKAGLDPDHAPSSASEIVDAARKITKLGGKVKGFTFGGNCGGCNTFAIEPMIFATKNYIIQGEIGHQTVNIENNTAFADVLTMLKTMSKENLMPAGARTEDGSTFGQDFLSGDVGITMNGLGTILGAHKDGFELGIGGIPAPDGSGVSTFAGGDVFVLPSAGKNAEASETFIDWVLQPQQQEMYPANGFTPVRTDILNDAFREKNPYVSVALEASANGYAPKSVAFQALYSNTGPWGPIFQKAVFDGDVDGAMKTGQQQFEEVLEPLDAQ